MPDKRLIYSERCWLEGKLQAATVVIENGRITDVVSRRLADAENVGNDILMPGVIDAHVHINDPGRTHWEGFETATKAAAAGGITTVVDMPLNSSPVTTNSAALHEKLNAAQNRLYINVGLYGGLIPGNLNELEGLIQEGVLGIKCFLVHSGIDEFPNVDEKDIDAAMPVIAKHGISLLAHCELSNSKAENTLEANPGSYKEYLASRPKKWEDDAIDMMIRLCRKHNCPVHIVHVSSADALKSIASAKAEGLPLTAETCAHYIYFNAEQIPDNKTIFKCAPPIREKENNDLLKKAFANDVLDFITTDHSPAPPDVKQLDSGNFQTGWGGIAGLQFLLPASWTALKEIMSIEKFIPLLTDHPAKFLKINDRKGKIQMGFDADLVIWKPEEKELITDTAVLHRHKMSPYVGETLYGTIKQTIVNGVTVYSKHSIEGQQEKAGSIVLNNNR